MGLNIVDLRLQIDCLAVTILFLCTIGAIDRSCEKSVPANLMQFQPFFERIILRLFRRPAVYNVECSYCYGYVAS